MAAGAQVKPPPFVMMASVMVRRMEDVDRVFTVLCPTPTHDHGPDRCMIEVSDELDAARFLGDSDVADVVVVPLEWFQQVTGIKPAKKGARHG